MRALIDDIRYALRGLWKNKVLGGTAILTVALGIGGTSAIASIVNGVLLQPLPYPNGERMVQAEEVSPSGRASTVAPANFLEWQAASDSFENMVAYDHDNRSLQTPMNPEHLQTVEATVQLFTMLGVRPVLGRGFLPQDGDLSNPNVAVLSAEVWHRSFGDDPNILRRTIILNDEPYSVIGVMPDGFVFPPTLQSEIWIPLRFSSQVKQDRVSHYLAVVGLLKPNVSLYRAATDLKRIAAGISQQYPEEEAGGVSLTDLKESIVGNSRNILLMFLGAVSFVLLIACVNVSNLLLARAYTRKRELAIRIALGARQRQITQQLLTESLIWAFAGGVAGLVLADSLLLVLKVMAAKEIPMLKSVIIDGRIFGFTFLLCLIIGIVVGLMPALRAFPARLVDDLKVEGGTLVSSARRRAGPRNSLVVIETALALILMMGAGLMLKSFFRLQHSDPGLSAENVVTMHFALSRVNYPENISSTRFYRPLLERLSALPAVKDVGLISILPLQQWGWNSYFDIQGRPDDTAATKPFGEYRIVSSGYFRTVKIPLIQGRFLQDQDADISPPVAVVNEAFAHQYFQGESPLGRSLRFTISKSQNPFRTIVGVVGDVKQAGLDKKSRPEVYLSYLQTSNARDMVLVINTANDPKSMAPVVRKAAAGIDPNEPLYNVNTMEAVISESLAHSRVNSVIINLFALVALLLSVAGVFGVNSFSIAQRRSEFGLRMALGSQHLDILKLVLWEGVRFSLLGVAIGIAGALALGRSIASFLYATPPDDIGVIIGVALLLFLTALVACYIPARKAMKVDPVAAIRGT